MSVNKIILSGNLARDPAIHTDKNGTVFADLVLAVDSRNRNNADFFEVVCTGVSAEFVRNYGCKGRRLLVEGSLRNNRWTDKDGNPRKSNQVLAQHVEFIDGKYMTDDSAGVVLHQGRIAGEPAPGEPAEISAAG